MGYFHLTYPTAAKDSDLGIAEESDASTFIFSWPLDHPHLEFEPTTGEIHAGSSVPVFVKFHSNEPISYQFSSVCCELVKSKGLDQDMVIGFNDDR